MVGSAGLVLAVIACLPLSAANNKAVNLKLRDLSGKKVALSDYRGKPVVVNFWATWCGPCHEEMPMLVEAAKTWEARGIAFIAVSLDDNTTVAKVPDFVGRFHVTFPVWVGGSADDLDRLQLGGEVPDTMFLDENGVVVARVLGEIRRPELDERLDWLAGDRKRPTPPAVVKHL